jgi:prepilin-type N-terminal cleavage/methylation domain-containing protein
MQLPRKKAFTLLEVLMVIVIIAILSSIVVIAINPARQIQESKDVQRSVDISTILDAVYQYSLDNGGDFPAGFSNLDQTIGTIDLDICSDLVPTYLAALPIDPGPDFIDAYYVDCTDYLTNYQLAQDATSGRITMTAPSAERSTITITK